MKQLGIISDGALLISDGRILEVGPARRVENLSAARRAQEISADGKVVMPGFVDSHTQPASAPLQLDSWEWGTAPGETARTAVAVGTYSVRRLELEARRSLRQFVRHGTTTVDARSGSGRDTATALKTLRALSRLRERTVAVSATLCWPRDADSAGAPELLTKIRRRRLAETVEVKLDGNGQAEIHTVLSFAKTRGLRVTGSLHAPDGGVVEQALAGGLSALHCLGTVSDKVIDLLAPSNTVLTLFPGVAFQQRLGCYPPARRLIDAGAAVSIATGFGPQLSATCSMPAVLSIACAEMGFTPAEAVTASTINSAFSLGISDRVGSLEVGKDADLVLFNASDYREIPYRFGMNLVAMSMKCGEVIYPRVEST